MASPLVRARWTLVCGLAIVACGPQHRPGPASKSAPEVALEDTTRRAGFPVVLVATPVTSNTREVWLGLKDELEPSFDIVTFPVTRDVTPDALGRALDEVKPACVVLMDNRTVRLYVAYQEQHPTTESFPPAVVLMTSFLDQIHRRVRNATGIAYEIPVVTIIGNLRLYLDMSIARIGVVYRPAFSGHIEKQRQLARSEHVDIIEMPVSDQPTALEVGRAIHTLREVHKVDALWILNDNALLTNREIVSEGWLPELQRANIPVIVGVPALVESKVPFGSFAMLPDPASLGVQAASLIYDLKDENWVIGDRGIEPPLSVYTVMDLDQARAHFRFREEMLGKIDRVIQR